MQQYYFLVSSLPYLQFEMPPPFSYNKYLDICGEHLILQDYKLLRVFDSIDLNPLSIKTMHYRYIKGLKDWVNFEMSLRNQLSILRAKNISIQDSEKYVRQSEDKKYYSIDAEKSAVQAFNESNPYQAEMIIQKARWNIIKDLEIIHHFDIGYLCFYGLKLNILLRNNHMQKEQGMENLEKTYNAIVQKEVFSANY